MSRRVLSIDLETYSDVDLVNCGVYRYVEGDFHILLFAYAFDNEETKCVDMACGEEYQTVMRHLCDIYYTLLYQQREIIGESVLSFNAQGYYEDKYHEYHCGDGIEYYFYDDWDEKYKWRTSRIEHNGNRYYIVGNPNIELNGLRVRHRKR